jgi:hypothetical protein
VTNEELASLWVAEYCPTQGAFHIQYLSETLKGNMRMIMSGRKHTYLLLAVCNSHEEAMQVCDFVRAKLEENKTKKRMSPSQVTEHMDDMGF